MFSSFDFLSTFKKPAFTDDYTECFVKEFFDIVSPCDYGACQLPEGAYCPGNDWFENPIDDEALESLIRPEVRILGGEPAIPNSWPWIVRFVDYGGQICGGSLLTSTWVITAAHCCIGGTLRVDKNFIFGFFKNIFV